MMKGEMPASFFTFLILVVLQTTVMTIVHVFH